MQNAAQVGLSILLFAATAAYAFWRGWRANDLVWAFWISGVVVTFYAAVAAPLFSLLRPREGAQPESWIRRIVEKIGDSIFNLGAGLLLVLLLFGTLGVMLNYLSPLVPNRDLESRGALLSGLFRMAGEALLRFWPFALASCASCSSVIFQAMARSRVEPESADIASTIAILEALRAGAVIVLAMFVQLGLGSISATGAAIANYLLLAVLLFPWTVLFDWSRRKGSR